MKNSRLSLILIAFLMVSILIPLNSNKKNIEENTVIIPTISEVNDKPGGGITATYVDTTLLGQWDENYGQAQDVVVLGDIAYVASYWGGIVTLDISNPSNPQILDHYETGYQARSINIVDDIAFVANDVWGTSIFNISDPNNIVYVTKALISGSHYYAWVFNDVLYSATLWMGIEIWNVANPNSPSHITNYQNASVGNTYSVQAYGDIAFVGYSGGMDIINVSNPASPVFISAYINSGGFIYADYDGRYCYYSADWGGLYILDLIDIYNPVLVANYDENNDYVQESAVIGSNLILSNSSAIKVLDISTLSSPTKVAQYNTYSHSKKFNITGNYLYLAEAGNGLTIIDIKYYPISNLCDK